MTLYDAEKSGLFDPINRLKANLRPYLELELEPKTCHSFLLPLGLS